VRRLTPEPIVVYREVLRRGVADPDLYYGDERDEWMGELNALAEADGLVIVRSYGGADWERVSFELARRGTVRPTSYHRDASDPELCADPEKPLIEAALEDWGDVLIAARRRRNVVT
jgi:hypothetical protein